MSPPDTFRLAVTLARGVRDDPPIRLRPGDRGYPESLEREFYLRLNEDGRAAYLAYKDGLATPSATKPAEGKRMRRQDWLRRKSILSMP